MGNEPKMPTRQWNPHDQPPPPPMSWRGRFLVDLVGAAGAAAVLILIGHLFYPALVERLPWTLIPLLGIFAGDWLRERRVRALAGDGLYQVHTRKVRADGTTARYRACTALTTPGYILCRRRSVQQDLELAITGVDRPRRNSWFASVFVTDGPTASMRVHTSGGDVDVRGRPEHLHLLASGAVSTSPTGR